MKSCPYCAEMIQDAAAKCRFCGEWLDPSKRPAWSADPAPAEPVAVAAVPRPPTIEPPPTRSKTEVAPATLPLEPMRPTAARPEAAVPSRPAQPTSEPATATPPRATRPAPSWEAPSAWLAHSHTVEPAIAAPSENRSGQTFVEIPMPGPPRATELTRDTIPEGVLRSEQLSYGGQASLEEVALRMQRIKASAAAVRQAVEEQLAEPTPRPPELTTTTLSSAQTVFDGPQPQPTAPPASLSFPNATTPYPASPPSRSAATIPATARPVAAPEAPMPAAVPRRPAEEIARPQQAPLPHAPAAAPAQAYGDFEEEEEDEGMGDETFGAAGFSDFEDDDEDFEDDGAGYGELAAPARPALPWRPIAAGAAVILLGAFLMRDRIFGSAETGEPDTAAAADGETPPPPDASGEVRSGSVAPSGPESGAIPTSQAAAQAGSGQPVTPEAAPIAAEADTPADPFRAEGSAQEPPAASAGSVPTPTVLAKLEEARELYKSAGRSKAKLESSRALLEEVLASSPDYSDALLILAQVQLELGEMDTALQTAERCTKLAAEQADCWLTIGTIKQEKRDNEMAVEAYERYLALAPDGRYAGTIRKLLKHLK